MKYQTLTFLDFSSIDCLATKKADGRFLWTKTGGSPLSFVTETLTFLIMRTITNEDT